MPLCEALLMNTLPCNPSSKQNYDAHYEPNVRWIKRSYAKALVENTRISNSSFLAGSGFRIKLRGLGGRVKGGARAG